MLSRQTLELIIDDPSSSELDKAEARRQLGLANVVPADAQPVSAPAVRKTDDDPEDEDEPQPPLPLERELVLFTRAEFERDEVPFFSRLDFIYGPKFERKHFDVEFKSVWLAGTQEFGILQWVPFSCIARFTDSIRDKDWREGGVLSNLWDRWLGERLFNFGMIDEEIGHEVRSAAASAGHELPAQEVKAQIEEVRQLYPPLMRARN
jgi:hypothetical protein